MRSAQSVKFAMKSNRGERESFVVAEDRKGMLG
jgi:hypothetical protein